MIHPHMQCSVGRCCFCCLLRRLQTLKVFTLASQPIGSSLGGEALGVAGEHAGLADVVQAAEEHDDTLQADAAAAVREGTEPGIQGSHHAVPMRMPPSSALPLIAGSHRNESM